MKLKIGYYEVEVKAKAMGDKRFSKQETAYFLNELSIWLDEAERSLRKQKLESSANAIKRASGDIYRALDVGGFYSYQSKQEEIR